MKRKILSAVLVMAFFAGVFVPVRGADKITEYSLGTTVSGTRSEDEDAWYSIKIESDGFYKIFQRNTTTNSISGGNMDIYDKTGSKNLFFVQDAGYDIIPHNFNELENAYIREYAIYLHEGTYLLRDWSFYKRGGVNQYTFKMEKITNPYGEDKEPNQIAADAIPLAFDTKAGGVMGGVFDDGKKDETDFYKIDIPNPMKCKIDLISDRAPVNFAMLNSKGEELSARWENGSIFSWDGELIHAWDRITKFNKLMDKFELNLEADIEVAGTYYIRLDTAKYHEGYNTPYNPYVLTVESGSGTPIEPKPIDPKDEILEVAIPGEPEGKLTALVTEVGIKFEITPNTAKFGYRIYRSTDPNEEGISISDFPLIEGKFVDVNIDPNMTYYYTIRKVISEAGFDRETMDITPEVLGDPSQKIVLNSGRIIDPPKPGGDHTKNFLLMKIDEPDMLFNETSLEIDPGRGTVPKVENGRTLIPIRAIIECMGGEIKWDDPTKTVSLFSGEASATDFEVVMTVGSKDMTSNGEKKTMDIAPQIINGRTMLPLRFVAENVGGEIAWVGSTREIIIVFYTKAL